MKNAFAALAGTALAIVVASQPANAGAGWTYTSTTITALNQQPIGGIGSGLLIIETSGASDPAACSASGQYYLSITDDRTKRIFAMLMEAQVADRSVLIHVTGNCLAPPWGQAEIDALKVM